MRLHRSTQVIKSIYSNCHCGRKARSNSHLSYANGLLELPIGLSLLSCGASGGMNGTLGCIQRLLSAMHIFLGTMSGLLRLFSGPLMEMRGLLGAVVRSWALKFEGKL